MAAVAVEQRPRMPRSEQNTPAAFVIALAMHALLFGALWISVQWHTEPAGAVVVELWSATPPPEPIVIAPTPPPPPVPVKVEPEKERPDADIVTKKVEERKPPPDTKKIEAERQRALEEARRLETEKRQRELEQKKQRELEQKKQRELEEQKKQAEATARAAEQKRDDERREAVRKSEQARMLAQAGSGGGAEGSPGGAAGSAGRGDGGYAGLLAGIIKPRIVFAVPDGTAASVSAEFEVELLPTGEILRLRLIKPSGLPGYDAAVERAIRRTDPFPRKPDGTVDRTLRITFQPVEK